MDDDLRKKGLEELVENRIIPFTSKTLSIVGIKELANTGAIYLLPAVRAELGMN